MATAGSIAFEDIQVATNLYQLQLFTAAADEKSFRSAAALLHLSPSALLRQIRGLEADLGLKLFVANGQGIALTDAGVALRKAADDLLRQATQFETIAAELRTGRAGTVTVACSPSHLGRYFAVAGSLFQRAFPNVAPALGPSEDMLSSSRCAEWQELSGGSFDLIVTSVDDGRMSFVDLWSAHLVVVCSDDDPLRDRGIVELDDLAERESVLSLGDHWASTALDELVATRGVSLDLEHARYLDGVMARARAGLAVAIVADDQLEPGLATALPRLVDADQNPVRRNVRLAWDKDRTLSKAARSFVEFVGANPWVPDSRAAQASPYDELP
jgi:LysR family transcriptional regulator, nitrogen assimilation regulatory protein